MPFGESADGKRYAATGGACANEYGGSGLASPPLPPLPPAAAVAAAAASAAALAAALAACAASSAGVIGIGPPCARVSAGVRLWWLNGRCAGSVLNDVIVFVFVFVLCCVVFVFVFVLCCVVLCCVVLCCVVLSFCVVCVRQEEGVGQGARNAAERAQPKHGGRREAAGGAASWAISLLQTQGGRRGGGNDNAPSAPVTFSSSTSQLYGSSRRYQRTRLPAAHCDAKACATGSGAAAAGGRAGGRGRGWEAKEGRR